MPFDWSTYKDLADELRLRDDEASKRSAISRLYYSVYGKAKNLLVVEDPNINVPAENSHAFVWRKFLNKGHTRRTVQRDGTRLKNLRVNADYEPEVQSLEENVEFSFVLAERLIETLDKLSGNK